MLYTDHYTPKRTPQTEQADPRQVENSAGGFSFVVDDWMRMQRFLILGTEGGSYYATERKLTRDNAKCIERCLESDPDRAVRLICSISSEGRAPKNDPAIFALALAAAHPKASKIASESIPIVCRTGTHLFQFVEQVKVLRGLNGCLSHGIAAWYESKEASDLMYQLTKYQQRNGMDHKRILRMTHPKLGNSPIARWVLGASNDIRQVGKDGSRRYEASGAVPEYLAAFDELKKADEKRTIELISSHRFTHEMIATHHRNSPEVWEALLPMMGMTALIRNLGKLSSVGLSKPLSATLKQITSKLTDANTLKKGRVHPLQILTALLTYQQGHGDKGSLKWEASRAIVDALDAAFYLSFKAIEPTGKRILLAIDVSGSMDMGHVGGVSGLTPRIAAATLAMVTARAESNWHCVGFSSGVRGEFTYKGRASKWGRRFVSGLTDLDISPNQRLEQVCERMKSVPMGRTDCALPMLYAAARDIEVDCFHVYTDNETWHGEVHPHQALKMYREKSGIPAKLAVVSMEPNEFTIADPSDAGMLDFVGFDSAAPAVLADFTRG